MTRAAPALLLVLAACGRGGADRAAPAPARTAEELLAPWVAVTIGEPVEALRARRPGLEPGYAAGARAEYIDARDPEAAVVTVETEAGVVRAVGLEWRASAADAAERELRARLPAPRECATLHEQVEDYKSLLWRLGDGASATAMRKGKTWRLTVSRPAADGFDSLFATCGK